jgi:hypothetical protein
MSAIQRALFVALVGVGATALVPAQAEAQENFRVTVYRHTLEQAMKQAVETSVRRDYPDIYFTGSRHVTVSRHTPNTMHIDLDMSYALNNVPNPSVDVDFRVEFKCQPSHPDLNIAVPYVDVDVNFPWWVDVGTGGLSWVGNLVADVFVERMQLDTRRLREELVAKINQTVNLPLDRCLSYEMQSSGDLVISDRPGTECTGNQTKHVRCGAGTTGPGRDYTCNNGRWQLIDGYCEARTPDGGDVP